MAVLKNDAGEFLFLQLRRKNKNSPIIKKEYREMGMSATFRLSAFGDEISADLAEQLKTLVSLNVRGLDLRSAWGKNVAKMEDEDVAQVKQVCAEYGVKIACLGSPSPLLSTRSTNSSSSGLPPNSSSPR